MQEEDRANPQPGSQGHPMRMQGTQGHPGTSVGLGWGGTGETQLFLSLYLVTQVS